MSRDGLSIQREHTGDPKIDAIWRRLQEFTAALNAQPLFSGRLLTEEQGAVKGSGLSFVAGTVRMIPHGLGRRARGFLECYGADMATAGHCRLTPETFQPGLTSSTHISAVALSTGHCWIYVF